MARAKAEAEGLRRAARQQAEHAEVLQRDCTALARKVAEVESAVTSAPEPMQVGRTGGWLLLSIFSRLVINPSVSRHAVVAGSPCQLSRSLDYVCATRQMRVESPLKLQGNSMKGTLLRSSGC